MRAAKVLLVGCSAGGLCKNQHADALMTLYQAHGRHRRSWPIGLKETAKRRGSSYSSSTPRTSSSFGMRIFPGSPSHS